MSDIKFQQINHTYVLINDQGYELPAYLIAKHCKFPHVLIAHARGYTFINVETQKTKKIDLEGGAIMAPSCGEDICIRQQEFSLFVCNVSGNFSEAYMLEPYKWSLKEWYLFKNHVVAWYFPGETTVLTVYVRTKVKPGSWYAMRSQLKHDFLLEEGYNGINKIDVTYDESNTARLHYTDAKNNQHCVVLPSETKHIRDIDELRKIEEAEDMQRRRERRERFQASKEEKIQKYKRKLAIIQQKIAQLEGKEDNGFEMSDFSE